MKISIKSLYVLALVSMLGLSACSQVVENKEAMDSDTTEEVEETEAVMEDEATEGKEADTDDEEMEETEEVSADEAPEPVYQSYSAEAYEELKGNRPFAVFFHADWCPTCVKMEANIQAELASFPAGTNILVASFDDETELKKEYGVTSQSTIVVVDAGGNKTASLGSPTNMELKDAFSSVL